MLHQSRNSLVLMLGFVSLLSGFGSFSGSAEASTLAWDRDNVDLDVAKYTVYGCFTPGCAVVQNAASVVVTLPQPASGLVPSVPVVTSGKAGAFAVSASDVSGNESGLSVPVPFDAQAPIVPLNPRLLP